MQPTMIARLLLLLVLAAAVAVHAARAQYYPPRPSNSAIILALASTSRSLHDASSLSDDYSATSARRDPGPPNDDDDDDDDDPPPITLPATFDLIGTNQDLTLNADGSFSVACTPGNPCPVRPPVGRGEFLVNLEDNSILFFQMIDPDKQWVVRQTWVIGAKDLHAPVWAGNWLRAHHGDRSEEWPVPKTATVWKRRE